MENASDSFLRDTDASSFGPVLIELTVAQPRSAVGHCGVEGLVAGRDEKHPHKLLSKAVKHTGSEPLLRNSPVMKQIDEQLSEILDEARVKQPTLDKDLIPH